MDPSDYWTLWKASEPMKVETMIQKLVDAHTLKYKWRVTLDTIRRLPTINRESGRPV